MTTLTAAQVFRKYETDGVPGSGIHQPDKAEIVAVLTALEEISNLGAGLAYGTVAEINLDLLHAPNTFAVVYADSTAANNGMYVKSGSSGFGSWVRVGDLPTSLVRLTVTGGTGNAIVASATETPQSPASKLYLMTPASSCSGASTVNVNGTGVVEIKTSLGSDTVTGSLVAGSQVLMAWSVDHYQLLISVPVDATGILNDVIAARDVAAASATAATASASALGNQVHQYDTRALAASATVPVGVQLLRTLGYTAAADGGAALFVRVASQPSHAGKIRTTDRFLPNGTTDSTNGGYWALADQLFDAKMFGADASGTADSLTALQNYRDYVIAVGSKTMVLTQGTYKISAKLELGFAGLKVIALGKVILKHSGSGVAVSFDAGAAPSTATLFDIEFGWGNSIYVQGNASTTDAILIRSCHHMKVNANVRDCTTAMRVNFSVCSNIILVCSSNVGGFTNVPANGLLTDIRNAGETVTDCVFNLVIEGLSGQGVDLKSCVGCEFRGTSEANAAGGVRVRGTPDMSTRNTFIGFDCEANGLNSQDWNIEGAQNVFDNIVGFGTTSLLQSIVSGSFNQFRGGSIQNLTIHSSSAHNYFRCVELAGTAVFGSASAVYESCFNASGTIVP